MPEIITSHLTHIYWALFCILVAVLVHFWPTIKTWWAARAAAAAAEEKRIKATLELAAGNVESVYTRIKGDLQAYVAGTEAKIKALEARIDAQVAKDTAASTTVNIMQPAPAAPPATPPNLAVVAPEAEQVHGWVPPAAPKA